VQSSRNRRSSSLRVGAGSNLARAWTSLEVLTPTGVLGDHRLDRSEVEEAQGFGALDGATQRLRAHDVREVEERARGRRDRDAVVDGDLGRGERPPRAVDRQPAPAPATVARGDRDVDTAAAVRSQAPQRRGTGVADDRAAPAGEDGGSPRSLCGQAASSDGEDAAMLDVQVPGGDARLDPALAQPECDELLIRHDIVPVGREVRDPPIEILRSSSWCHAVHEARRRRSSPPGAAAKFAPRGGGEPRGATEMGRLTPRMAAQPAPPTARPGALTLSRAGRRARRPGRRDRLLRGRRRGRTAASRPARGGRVGRAARGRGGARPGRCGRRALVWRAR
jgi:hypothetical protein